MEKKKLLIYAHYYIPDTASTGQILRELAEGMLDKFDITVICVVPSYLGTIEDKYKTQKYYEENINGVKVLRIRVPEFSKTNKKSRIKNIVSYFFGAMAATFKVGKMDYVFSISQPPILGGLLGVWGKWVKHAKYIYNIQDFNPEQVLAVGYSKSKLITDVMMWFDKFSCKRSNLIITVGRDLVETVEKRFTGKKVPKTVMINNWIDEKEIYPLDDDNEKVLEFKKKYGLDGMLGAPVGTALSFIVGYGIIMNIYYQKVIGIDVAVMFKNIFSKTWLCLAATSVITSFLNVAFSTYSWITLMIKIAIFCVLFLLFMAVYGFSEMEKNDISGIVKRIIRR